MPTGSGKSLTYQLTSQVLPGATLVVSPLLALIRVAQDSRAFLVLGAGSPLFRGGGLEWFLDAIDEPMLVMR
jgi:hypothetical protein